MDAADKDATIEYLLGHIKAQEAVIAALQQELAEAKALIKLQAFEIARLKRVVFGPRGERVSPDQHSLPGIDVADNDAP